MNYKQVISNAWHITQNNKRLIKFYAFVPSLIGTAIGILELLYQIIAFKKAHLFSGQHERSFAGDIIIFAANFFEKHTSLSLIIIPFIIIIILLYFLLAPFTRAASIQLIARIYNGQKVLLRDGFQYGTESFMRMFGYVSTIKKFSIVVILGIFAFFIRNIGISVFQTLWLPVLLITIIAWLIGILLTYTEYFIVIDGLGIKKSMWKSIKTTIYYYEHTLLLVMLMIFIGARIILNAIFVFLIPIIIIISTSLVAAITLEKIGLVIGLIIGFCAYIFVSYLNAVVDVWSMSVWVITFLHLSAENEKTARDIAFENLPEEIKNVENTDADVIMIESEKSNSNSSTLNT